MNERILVDKKALTELLNAFRGPGYLVRELIAIAPIGAGPIPQLVKDLVASETVEAK